MPYEDSHGLNEENHTPQFKVLTVEWNGMRVVVGIERGYLVGPLSLIHTFYISQPAAMISSPKFLGWSHRAQKYTIDGCFY